MVLYHHRILAVPLNVNVPYPFPSQDVRAKNTNSLPTGPYHTNTMTRTALFGGRLLPRALIALIISAASVHVLARHPHFGPAGSDSLRLGGPSGLGNLNGPVNRTGRAVVGAGLPTCAWAVSWPLKMQQLLYLWYCLLCGCGFASGSVRARPRRCCVCVCVCVRFSPRSNAPACPTPSFPDLHHSGN